MGTLLSKTKQQKKIWSWSGPPGEHSPYPTDPAPYPGYPIKYCFLDIMAGYRVMEERVNFGPRAVTTNVEEYLGDLRACYAEGYRLNSFVRVPDLKTSVEVEDWTVERPYQAILSKRDKTFQDKNDNWELHLEKKILSTKVMHFDCFDDENSLLVTIQNYAQKGGRLICTEPVGYMRSNTTNTQYGAMGVELFFDLPRDAKYSQYTYHAMKIPTKYHIALDATQTIQQIVSEADFGAQMKLFLDKGWKLIDVCMDTIALAEAFRMKTNMKYIDTLWIFEKEKMSLEDDTPQYEGVVIEYLHKVKNTLSGDYPCNDWRPVIAGMGVMGWELATILQTPAIVQSTFTNYTIKLLMLFQRRLIPSFDHYRSLRKKTTVPSGGNSSSNNHKKKPQGDVFMAKGQDEQTSGYYNSTLKKYIYHSRNGPDEEGNLPDLLRDLNARAIDKRSPPFSWNMQIEKPKTVVRNHRSDFLEAFRNVLVPVT